MTKIFSINKYAYTLFKEIQAQLEEENKFSYETRIADLFFDNFNELSLYKVLLEVELIYGFEIPDALCEQHDLTILQFGEKLSKLPQIPRAFYLEFYELKVQMVENVLRSAEIKNGLEEGTQEEIDEINERLEFITKRLKEITELPLN